MQLEDLLMYQTDLMVPPFGNPLFTVGERGDAMYVLMSGRADVVVRDKVVETAEVNNQRGQGALFR